MSQRFTIVGIGEALFDVFSHGQCLGDAPLSESTLSDESHVRSPIDVAPIAVTFRPVPFSSIFRPGSNVLPT